MAKDKGSSYERGIKDDADYGTQFLNARGGPSGSDEPPSQPPPPTPTPDEEPASGGRGVGTVVMVLLAVGAIGAGIAGFLLFGGGEDGPSGDLVTAGEIEIDENGFPVRQTTTTTEARATTTTAPTTTTTVAPTTTTTPPGVPTTGINPQTPQTPQTPPQTPATPPPTNAPSCPGGTTQTTLSAPYSGTGDGQWRINLSGTTTNDTNAAFDLLLVVSIEHEPTEGRVTTMTVRPDQYGRSVAAGGSIDWTATVNLASVSPPETKGASGPWAWSDDQYGSCPTGTFG